jgi:hypothetical protein
LDALEVELEQLNDDDDPILVKVDADELVSRSN